MIEIAVAGELEDKLVAVNQTSALRPDTPGGKRRQEKVMEMPRMEATDEERRLEEKKAKRLVQKRKAEKERRSKERDQMERVALLFKVPENSDWTRKDALSLGKIIPYQSSKRLIAHRVRSRRLVRHLRSYGVHQ